MPVFPSLSPSLSVCVCRGHGLRSWHLALFHTWCQSSNHQLYMNPGFPSARHQIVHLLLWNDSATLPASSQATSVSCSPSANQQPTHRFTHSALLTHQLSPSASLSPACLHSTHSLFPVSVIKPFISHYSSCLCLLLVPTKTNTVTWTL